MSRAGREAIHSATIIATASAVYSANRTGRVLSKSGRNFVPTPGSVTVS